MKCNIMRCIEHSTDGSFFFSFNNRFSIGMFVLYALLGSTSITSVIQGKPWKSCCGHKVVN